MNFDDYEHIQTNNVTTNMTAGALAGIMEHCVMYPLDSVKTRMQSLSPLRVGETITSTMSKMMSQEGIFRPMRGVGAVVLGAGPAHAFYFSTYEFTKEYLAKYPMNDNVNYVMSATTATLLHDAISNPTEVIKQRMQMYNSPYKSVIQCARQVFQQEGISAFYRSYTTQLVMNLPYQAIHFTTYEFFQKMLNTEKQYNPKVHMVAGALAGAAAAAFTTPLDVCKTLLNTQEDGIGATKGLKEAVKKVYRAAGMRGFFKGMQARILYQMPATAICWSTYEFFKYFLNRTEKKKILTSPAPGVIQFEQKLAYVLPSSVSADGGREQNVPANNSSMKPRELPAMSSAGNYGALSYNTIHTDTQSSSHFNDCRPKT